MPMDEVIRAIEQSDSENIQDLVDAVFRRYRELFPEWEIVYFSIEKAKLEGQRDEAMEVLKLAYKLSGQG